MSWGTGVSDIGSKFAFNYGGGVKIRPAGPIGVRFDARGYSVFGVQSQTLKLGEVSVGLLFSF
jgi:opacity protein-like surface antigen